MIPPVPPATDPPPVSALLVISIILSKPLILVKVRQKKIVGNHFFIMGEVKKKNCVELIFFVDEVKIKREHFFFHGLGQNTIYKD